jgi:hypothetical protein
VTQRMKLLMAAALFSLALAGLWHWQSVRSAEKAARKQAWFEYLHGPLSDLLYGTSRLRPLILKKKLSKADQAEAAEALGRLEDSYKRTVYYAVFFENDPAMAQMIDVADWHHQIFNLYQPFHSLHGTPLAKEAVVADGELRQALWVRVNGERTVLLKDEDFSKDETLEMNALLYSLHEKSDE